MIDQNSNSKVPRCFKILTLPLVVSVVSVNMSSKYYMFGHNRKKVLFCVYLYSSAKLIGQNCLLMSECRNKLLLFISATFHKKGKQPNTLNEFLKAPVTAILNVGICRYVPRSLQPYISSKSSVKCNGGNGVLSDLRCFA